MLMNKACSKLLFLIELIHFSSVQKNRFVQQICKLSLKVEMEGEQIPKATMANYLKARLKPNFNTDFANRILLLAKQYVNKITEEANEQCSKNSKKTINTEHVQSALQNLGLGQQLVELRQVQSSLKQQNQIRQQYRQKIQESIQKNLQQIKQDHSQKRVVEVRSSFEEINLVSQKNSEDEYDYEAEMNEVEDDQQVSQEMQKKEASDQKQKDGNIQNS